MDHYTEITPNPNLDFSTEIDGEQYTILVSAGRAQQIIPGSLNPPLPYTAYKIDVYSYDCKIKYGTAVVKRSDRAIREAAEAIIATRTDDECPF